MNEVCKSDAAAQAMIAMTAAQASASSLAEILDALAHIFAQFVGHRIFTVSVFESGHDLIARRIWSSRPDVYPVGGTKGGPCDEWVQQVIGRREIFLCHDAAEVRRVMPDHETIFGLGCGSVLNLPVCLSGATIGTVNLLHEPLWFTPERVQKATMLRALAYAPMLLSH